MLTELEAEYRRHCEAITALAVRFDAFVRGQGNHAHVHLLPTAPHRQQVEARLHPPVEPPAPST